MSFLLERKLSKKESTQSISRDYDITNQNNKKSARKLSLIFFFFISFFFFGFFFKLQSIILLDNILYSHQYNIIDSSFQENTQEFGDTSIQENTQEFGIARYSNGTLGLIIDPSQKLKNSSHILRRNRSCVVDGAIDQIAYDVFKLVRIGAITAKTLIEKKKREFRPKILCMVYTHSASRSRIQAIVNTWGSQCDGFFAASNVTDLSINSIDIVHKGPEMYKNMWQKVRSILKYAYDNFLDDYDYFHISGDDSYVVVDNMRNYLQGTDIKNLLDGYIDNFSKPHFQATKKWKNMTKGQSRPLLLGIPLLKGNQVFPQGGSGYTLNREALRVIGDKNGPLYTVLTEEIDPREDIFIAALLSEVATYVSDTRDDTGAFRYIPYQPKRRVKSRAKYPKRYNVLPVLSGMDLSSKETVALHLRDMDSKNISMGEVIYRTHDIITGECDEKILQEHS